MVEVRWNIVDESGKIVPKTATATTKPEVRNLQRRAAAEAHDGRFTSSKVKCGHRARKLVAA